MWFYLHRTNSKNCYFLNESYLHEKQQNGTNLVKKDKKKRIQERKIMENNSKK